MEENLQIVEGVSLVGAADLVTSLVGLSEGVCCLPNRCMG